MRKKNLVVSFSAGETSAFMAYWLWKNKRDDYDMVFVFANTGEENEKTLEFAEKCSKYFGFKLYWIETKVHHGVRKGSTFSISDFKNAKRKGEPFEEVIKKYGIPNQSFPHCTRELKARPIEKFAKSYFFLEEYQTAIGIRPDEADRINPKAKELGLVYPLISWVPTVMTKEKINFFWSQQPFRLELKGYQGNCKTCFKKSDKKLFTIAKENPEYFEFNHRMETTYPDKVFFRGHRSAKDILEQSKNYNKLAEDDKLKFPEDLVGGESCEIFSGCGD